MAAGQKPVIDAWIRLPPTKAVSSSQYGLASSASARLARTRSSGECHHGAIDCHGFSFPRFPDFSGEQNSSYISSIRRFT